MFNLHLLLPELLVIFKAFAYLYPSCLFSLLLKEDKVDIEKINGVCSLTFVEDEVLGLFLNPSIFSNMQART